MILSRAWASPGSAFIGTKATQRAASGGQVVPVGGKDSNAANARVRVKNEACPASPVGRRPRLLSNLPEQVVGLNDARPGYLNRTVFRPGLIGVGRDGCQGCGVSDGKQRLGWRGPPRPHDRLGQNAGNRGVVLESAAMGVGVVLALDQPGRIHRVIADDSLQHLECRMRVRLIDTHSQGDFTDAQATRRSADDASVLTRQQAAQTSCNLESVEGLHLIGGGYFPNGIRPMAANHVPAATYGIEPLV